VGLRVVDCRMGRRQGQPDCPWSRHAQPMARWRTGLSGKTPTLGPLRPCTPVAAGLAKLQLARWVSAITGPVPASMETRCASARCIRRCPAQSVRDGPRVGRDFSWNFGGEVPLTLSSAAAHSALECSDAHCAGDPISARYRRYRADARPAYRKANAGHLVRARLAKRLLCAGMSSAVASVGCRDRHCPK
jgi:hypothetical protein